MTEKHNENFLAEMLKAYSPSTATIPDHSPLICLVHYLFLKFEDEKNRIKKTHDLFFKSQNDKSLQELTDELKKNKVALKCYQKAAEAQANQVIETYEIDPEPSGTPPVKNEITHQAYTISFLIWAEKEGYKIPEYMVKENKTKIEVYSFSKNSRQTEAWQFPKITTDELTFLIKEPLWSLAKAVILVLGYNIRTSDNGKVLDFVQYKRVAQQVIRYATDANKTGNLEFYSEPGGMADANWILNTKVQPEQFIEWAKALPLYLPGMDMLDKTPKTKIAGNEKALHTKERETLLKMIIGLAVDGYGFDPAAARSPVPKEISDALAARGISLDADTIRKWLREAAEFLPPKET